MYLTRFAINPARRGGRNLLGSPQAMHAAVLAGFPPGIDTSTPDGGRVLWRVDHGENQAVHLFVVSPCEPDLTHLVEQAGWPTTSAWQTRDYSPLLQRLQAGQRWAFRLTANPVRSGRVAGKEDTQPLAHVTADQQRGWLLERASRLGFACESPSGEPTVVVNGRRTVRFARQGAQVTIAQATFDGQLEVREPDVLRHALVAGIGRAKGYGCGLMTLAPLR